MGHRTLHGPAVDERVDAFVVEAPKPGDELVSSQSAWLPDCLSGIMDLYGEAVPEEFYRQLEKELNARLGFAELRFIPLSARYGDNVALRSPRTPCDNAAA